MERLNTIMGRTTQRRQTTSNQREQSGQPNQVNQRGQQAQHGQSNQHGYYDQHGQQAQQEQRYIQETHEPRTTPSVTAPALQQRSASRRPLQSLPEQTARQGQQRPYAGTRPTGTQHPQATVRRQLPQGEPASSQAPLREGRPSTSPSIPLSRSLRPRPASPYEEQMANNEQVIYREEQFQQRWPMQSPRNLQAYQRADDMPYHSSPIQGDVAGEWEDDEDIAGMRYDDWEDEGDEGVVSQHVDIEPTFPAAPPRSSYQHSHYPAATSRLQAVNEQPAMPSLEENEKRSHTTRNLREISMPYPTVSQLPPTQPGYTQEVQRPHRMTQPLNSHLVAQKDHSIATSQAIHYEQRQSVRQVVSHQTMAIQQHRPVAASITTTARNSCPKCKGAGYLRLDVPFGHPNFGRPVACECKESEKREKRRQQLLELSDLNAFRQKNFSNFNTRFAGVHPSVQEAFQQAYHFAQEPNGWLLLVGSNGCGKTHLAAAIANQSLNAGAVVLFTVVPDLLAHLRASFGPNSVEAYDQRFAKMREAELLVLDDLGAHQSSPWANEKLFQLLNYRYNLGFPTVITANRQGLASVDDRILSRLSDTALVTTVTLNGALDYRRQNPRR